MLKIITCIKFVRAELFYGKKHCYNGYVLNPYDAFMLERLFELKKNIECQIIGISLAPEECIEAAHRCIAMGLSDVYLISDPKLSGSDTYSTSYILTKAIEFAGGADIYAFGEKSIDGETGQVPIGVSSYLELPCYTGVETIKMFDENSVSLECNYINKVEEILPYPPFSVCFHGFTTMEPEISLIKLKRSQNHMPILLNLELLQADERYCGQNGSKTKVNHIASKIGKRFAREIEGDYKIKAKYFETLISERRCNI